MRSPTLPLPRALSLLVALLLLAGSHALLPGATASHAQQPKAQAGPFALTNARIQTVTNGVIESGTVVIEGDSIAAVGADVSVPEGVRSIDVGGSTVYPGMIDAGTRLGLVEVGSLSETRDYSEIGQITPHMQALTAVNPSSVAIPVTRVNGVTTVLTEPSGGLFPGTAALIDLFGYTPRQMYRGFEAVTLNFPATGRRGSWDDRSEEQIEKEAEEALEKLNDTWEQATLYARIDSAYQAGASEGGQRPEYAPAMRALAPVVRGEMPLMVKVDQAPDITAAIAWAREHGLTDNVIFSGVAEGWRVADEIAEAGIPVLAGPVLSTPDRDADRYDKPYANAGLLSEAGVEVALRTGEAENVRNLPYHAGFAVAYGMDRTAALEAVTIAPARIFGLEGQLGSVEAGKVANLFVADGDPFRTTTDVEHLFIEGRKVPLTSRHTELYREFLERAPGVEGDPGEQSNPERSAGSDGAAGLQ